MTLVEIPDDLLLRLYTQRSAEQETALLERVTQMEARMTELSGEIAAQTQAITDLDARIASLDTGALTQQVAELQEAQRVAEEARAALAEAEASEDVVQDSTIAQLTTDRDTAAAEVTRLTDEVATSANEIASGVEGVRANTQRLSQLAQTQPPTP